MSFLLARFIPVVVVSLSRVRLLAPPWTTSHQAPLSTGFSQARTLERELQYLHSRLLRCMWILPLSRQGSPPRTFCSLAHLLLSLFPSSWNSLLASPHTILYLSCKAHLKCQSSLMLLSLTFQAKRVASFSEFIRFALFTPALSTIPSAQAGCSTNHD